MLLGGLALLALAEAGLVADLSESGQRPLAEAARARSRRARRHGDRRGDLRPLAGARDAGRARGRAVPAAARRSAPSTATSSASRARDSSAGSFPSTGCSAPQRSRSPGTRSGAREIRPVPMLVSVPAIAFLADRRGLADLDGRPRMPARTCSPTSCSPSACSLGVVARAPYPPWMTRVLAVIAVALATLFAVVGIVQAATQELWFFSPSVEVGNAYSSFFRVTSLFRDPSLYAPPRRARDRDRRRRRPLPEAQPAARAAA